MITAHPHALVSSDVTRNMFTINSGLIILLLLLLSVQIHKNNNPSNTNLSFMLINQARLSPQIMF